MTTLVQIIYISRSTSAPVQQGKGVDPVVARILAKSRSNNRKRGLVGVLYFGDGCFFQCLEGEQVAVDTLYAKLLLDPRHKDLEIISRKTIAERTFADWSMKYVPVERAMTTLLQSSGFNVFDPYRFDQAMTQQVIELLLSAQAAPEQPAPVAQTRQQNDIVPATPNKSSSAKVMLLGCAGLLLAAGLLVFYAG